MTANWGALWNIMKALLKKKDKKSRKGSNELKGDDFKNVDVHGHSMSGGVDYTGKGV